MPRHLVILFLVLAVGTAFGGAKRTPLLLTVHLETDGVEGPNFSFPMPVPGTGGNRFFKKSAEITNREVDWFYLFPAESGNGYGAVFKFNSVGTNRLEYTSSSNQGRHLLIAAHPAVSSFVLIDKVISDGIVVIWEGLTEAHVVAFRENMQERSPAAPAGEAPEEAAPGAKKKRNLFRKPGS